jgi:hypothetical protein
MMPPAARMIGGPNVFINSMTIHSRAVSTHALLI